MYSVDNTGENGNNLIRNWCGSLPEILSRSEIPFAICDKCSCRTKRALIAQINDIHFGKQRILSKINVITICSIIAYVMPLLGPELCPCWDPNPMLNDSYTKYRRERMFSRRAQYYTSFVSSAISPLTSARARTGALTVRHRNFNSLNPTCSCKRGTKNVRNR